MTGIAFDSWNRYTGQGVLENNLLIGNGGSGFELINNNNGDACGAPVLARYNTAGANLQAKNYTTFLYSNSEYNFAGVTYNYCRLPKII
jgi:hypothetical protein